MSVFRLVRKSHCSGWSVDDFLLLAFSSDIENCCAIFSISLSARFSKIALLREWHGQSSHPHVFPWVKDRVVPQAGLRQSRVLRAEGERLLWICRAQREAQGLRILSVSAAPIDKRAITVRSPAALKLMANGRLSKIIFPFKVSQLIRQGAKFLVIKETEEGRYRMPRDG
jgi:hypothetical protein